MSIGQACVHKLSPNNFQCHPSLPLHRLPRLVEFQRVLPASVVPIDVTRHFAIVRQLLTPVDPDAVACALPRLGASIIRYEALAPMIVPANCMPPGRFAAIIPLLEHDRRSPFRAMQRVACAGEPQSWFDLLINLDLFLESRVAVGAT